MVPQSGEQAAREILGDIATGDLSTAHPAPIRLLAGAAAVAVIVLLGAELS